MDEFKVSHLPVVEGVKFLGLVAEPDLLDLNSPEEKISHCDLNMLNSPVYEHQHIFEVVKTISDLNISIIPVLNEKENYIGSITLRHLMHIIAELSLVSGPGSTIVLEMNTNDYSLSEISQIIEGNDARILGTYLTSHPNSTKIEVTVKVNKSDLGAILQTFNRYDYTVSASYDQGDYGDILKDRYDSLMNYLNI
ncbi:MAG: CBS domain-containing protein [Flavobacteriales bacterium]|nr:MAG: CBS domain-containing protein [Flavobacteriales bacterium]